MIRAGIIIGGGITLATMERRIDSSSKWHYLENSYKKLETIKSPIIEYKTLQFIDDLKNEIENTFSLADIGVELQLNIFSEILGFNPNYIKGLMFRIRESVYNFQDELEISDDKLKLMSDSLIRRFGIIRIKPAIRIIDNYRRFIRSSSIHYFESLFFLENLRFELFKLLTLKDINQKLFDNKLSEIINYHPDYIYETKKKLTDKNPNFLFSKNVLINFFITLKNKNSKNNDLSGIRNLINLYFSKNDVPVSNYGILKNHPNFKVDYFKNINSLEKAYWLGLLFGEGGMTQRSKDDTYNLKFGLEMSLQALDLIQRFADEIGFSPESIGIYTKYKYSYYITDTASLNIYAHKIHKKYAQIMFVNRDFCQFLIDLGFLEANYYIPDTISIFAIQIIQSYKKANTIRLPYLGDIKNNRDFYLSFLLGIWDAEGKQGETRITSGSRLFLEDIKNLFNIQFPITMDPSNSGVYHLYLGADLLREILESYKGPLPTFYKRSSFNSIKLLRDLL